MGLFSEKKQYTAATSLTESLVIKGIDADSAKLVSLMQFLRESKANARESGQVLRKVLKQGSSNEKASCLNLIEALVDNDIDTENLLIKPKVDEQIILLAFQYVEKRRGSFSKTQRMCRHAYNMLVSWSSRPDKNISKLYARAGINGSHTQSKHKSYHPDAELDHSMYGTHKRHSVTSRHSMTSMRTGESSIYNQSSNSVYGSKSPFDDPDSININDSVSNRSERVLRPDHDGLKDREYSASHFRRSPNSSIDNFSSRNSNFGSIVEHSQSGSTHPDQDLDESIFGAPRKHRSIRESLGLKKSDHSSVDFGSADFHQNHNPNQSMSLSQSHNNNRDADTSRTSEPMIHLIQSSHDVSSKLVHLLITQKDSIECEVYYNQAKALRKRVVDAIRKNAFETRNFTNDLLTCNEELISALQSYNSIAAEESKCSSENPFESVGDI